MNIYSSFFEFNLGAISGEIWMSIFLCIALSIFCVIIGLIAKRTDPLAKPKGIMIALEYGVTFVDNMVLTNMGKRFKGFAPYIMVLCIYIFGCFLVGLTGLPNPLTDLLAPLSLALITFLCIHFTAAKYNKWGYFKRYIDPFAVFLPINLLSMWAPLLSLSFRLFGNALSGWVLMSIIYWALDNLSALIFSGFPYAIAPFIAPVFHLYFDLFSGFIQTTVFVMLTMLFVAQEGPGEEEDNTRTSPSNTKNA